MVPESEEQPGSGMVGLENRQEQVDQVQEGGPALGLHGKGKALPLRRPVNYPRHFPPGHSIPAGEAIDKLTAVTALSSA